MTLKLPSLERKNLTGWRTEPGHVIAYLGQQVAQLRLSLKAPQPSGVGAGHVHYQVVSQGAQDANPLRVVRSSVHRGLILPQVYSQWQPLCEDRSSRFCPQTPFPVQHAQDAPRTSARDLPGRRDQHHESCWPGCLLTERSSPSLRSSAGATTRMFYCIVPFFFFKNLVENGEIRSANTSHKKVGLF